MKKKVYQRIKKALTTPEFVKILLLRTVGNFLVLISVFMIGKTFYLPVKEEIRYFIDQKFNKKYVVAEDLKEEAEKEVLEEEEEKRQVPKGLLAKAFNVAPLEILIPEDPNFSVVIPKIAANSRVIGNTNPADEKEYLAVLKKGVAHARGTAYPGEGSHIFLFAHSTDYIWNVGTYNAVFYLLYKLEKADEINLFYQGQRYVYQVIDKQVVNADQVQFLTRKSNREFLTLQTCWPPGTTLKRLLIFATRVRE